MTIIECSECNEDEIVFVIKTDLSSLVDKMLSRLDYEIAKRGIAGDLNEEETTDNNDFVQEKLSEHEGPHSPEYQIKIIGKPAPTNPAEFITTTGHRRGGPK